MEPTRKILTESEVKEWFENFGDPEKGLTYENIFEDMKLKNNDTWVYKVYVNILFVKMRITYYDTFSCTPCSDNMERFMIMPQVDMNLL